MTAPARTRRLVVVGASLAGLRVVEGARDAGFDGELTLIGDEPVAPYDRTVLSTRFLEDREEPQTPVYRPADDLRRDLDVDLRLGVAAHTLDPRSRTVHAGGHTIPYDALVIATGVRPRTPGWAANLAGVHLLRTVADARALRKSLARSRRVVVVGGGFIGSEVASSARTLGLHVTIVEARDVPFAAALGETAGRLCAALHRAHGTELRCGVTVTALDGTGRVEKVLLSDGSVLKADTVVVGVGSHPNTEWLKGSGVACTDGVECDAALRTTVPGVYAVGDVARWFNPWLGRKVRVEHWTNAAHQAAAVARGIATGQPDTPHASIPYFWSDWYGRRIQFIGEPTADETAVVGDPARGEFACLYRTGERITGALTVGGKGAIARYRTAIRRRAAWQDVLHTALDRTKTVQTGGTRA